METYLDYAAITPVRAEVEKLMLKVQKTAFANPSSIHSLGQKASEILMESRVSVASSLGCREKEIIFTAGGTESVNLAILGRSRRFKKPHVITTVIEHHAVLDACKQIEKEGGTIAYLPVDQFGFVKVKDVVRAVRPETVLVSVMYANNEIGTVEPIREIGKELRKLNIKRVAENLPKILFHSDACQAAVFLDLNVYSLGVDLFTLNGNKIYGPRQFGTLFVKDGSGIDPIIFGGGQERGLRSGTENVPAAAGFALALNLSQKEKNKESVRLEKLRNYFFEKIKKGIPDLLLNGPEISTANRGDRLPNNLNISILGTDGESMVIYLDAAGIACSTGSACSTALTQPSHVIKALSGSVDRAKSSLRFTLGRDTDKKKLDNAAKEIIHFAKEQRLSI